MATTTFSSFLPGILVDVPSCPDIAVEREVRNAAIEFCRRSFAWRQQIDPIPVVAGTGEYSLDSPIQGARIVKIYDVVLTTPQTDPAFAPDVRQLFPKTVQALDAANPGWRYPQTQLTSNLNVISTNWYTQDSPASILLAGVPALDGSLAILASLVPTMTATRMDAWVAEQYYEAICHGAKARLMAVPQKPWSNPPLAGYHAGEFDKAISGANVEAATSFQSDAPIRTTSYSK